VNAKRPQDDQGLIDQFTDLDGLDGQFAIGSVERRKLAHELRTSFGVILSRVEALLDDPVAVATEAQRTAYLNEIHLAVHHALEVVETATIMPDDVTTPTLQVVDMSKAVREACRLVEAQAQDADIKLSFEPSKEKVSVRIKPSALRQILLNILVNAIKFTPSGGEVCIEVAATDCSCTVRVKDNGIGIAPAELMRIKRGHPGQGYGYEIVRLLATWYSAELSVESRRNHGTTVSATFQRDGIQ